jgi:ribonuclease HI
LHQKRGPTIERQEIILLYLAPLWWRGPLTSIAVDPQTATREHNKELRDFPNNLHIYTDGSGISGHVDAAAVSPTTGHIRKAYMGTSDITTVYVGELQGIKLALLIASDDQKAGRIRDKIVIYTDNQVAIRTSGNPTGRSGAYIIADIVHLIDKLQRGQRLKVEIRWILAHIGVPGNELADSAAKEAAGWTARG